MHNFALIGAGGYIAPRHMKAIQEVNGNLIAVTDPNDSVGILDSFSYDIAYFKEFERFDRYLNKTIQKGNKIDYISICSPNYMHDSHCLFGLRIGSDVICEKPITINPWNCKYLIDEQDKCDNTIYAVLQLRLHKTILELKNKIESGPKDKIYDIDLTYFTSRGPWYQYSWKGDEKKSGGIAMNIGIHFFDMLLWIFGEPKTVYTIDKQIDYMKGVLVLDRANVNWQLSTNYNRLPNKIKNKNKTTYRSIKINNEEMEFSDGFTELHNQFYKTVINKTATTIADAYPAIKLVYDINHN